MDIGSFYAWDSKISDSKTEIKAQGDIPFDWTQNIKYLGAERIDGVNTLLFGFPNDGLTSLIISLQE